MAPHIQWAKQIPTPFIEYINSTKKKGIRCNQWGVWNLSPWVCLNSEAASGPTHPSCQFPRILLHSTGHPGGPTPRGRGGYILEAGARVILKSKCWISFTSGPPSPILSNWREVFIQSNNLFLTCKFVYFVVSCGLKPLASCFYFYVIKWWRNI